MPSDPTASRGPTLAGGLAGEALRILVVDESARDRETLRDTLASGLPGCRVLPIADPAELGRRMEAGDYDVVITDHRPGWVDAFELLAAVRHRDPDLPILFCTGAGSEELAVAAMKAGFDDYILKHPHHFPRLVSAVRSALDESSRRRVAREAETRYRTLFEGVPVGLYRATLSGQVLDANPALIRLLGFPSRESLMAVNLRDIHADPKSRRAFLERLEREGEVHDLELQWKRYGGQMITVRKGARPVRDASGRLLHYEGVVEDITESDRARRELQESNQFQQEIISGAGEGIIVLNPELRYTVFNAYMERMTGLSADRVLGRRCVDVFPFVREHGIEELLKRAAAGETVSSNDVPYDIVETGKSGWAIATYGPHRNAAGQIVGVIGILHDVTDRRAAEAALRESEARYRIQIEHAPEAIVVFDVDEGRFVDANENAIRLYGLPRHALYQVGPAQVSPPIQPGGRPSEELALEKITEALNGGTPEFEWTHRGAQGREVQCEIRLVRLPSATRRLVRGSVTDITARKRSERIRSALYRIAAAATSAEDIDAFYAAIQGIVGELMYAKNFYVALHDPAAQMLSFPYCVDEFDAPPAPRPLRRGLTELVLQTGEALLMPDEDFGRLVAEGKVEEVGSPSVDWLGVPLKRGSTTFGVLVVQSYDKRFRYETIDREVLTFVSQQIAVALERKHAAEALRESEERYRLLFERNFAGVYRSTLQGRIIECNDALAKMFGYADKSELVGREIGALYPPPDGEDFLESLKQYRQLVNYERLGKRKSGAAVWTLENAALLADEKAGEIIIEGTVTDITERKILEEQLRQAQKMEAIGQLAGGIAHDFNNLLTTVLGYSDMAIRQLSHENPVRAEIEEIRRAGERAANLTRQLLAFGRKQVFDPRILDVNALIADSSRMLGRLIGAPIRLVAQLDPAVGSVRADPGQLEQVIVNLVVNARDAMPEGGTLTIRTENADVDEASSRFHFGVPAGRWVVVAVSDTGMGIDADAQRRLFEPFFSTKDRPSGAGLGLATAYGIVSQSGGQIFCASEPGQGATFAVYLPRVQALALSSSDRREEPEPARGTETILLVEDESAVRDLTRRCLESSGYTVLPAGSAEEALDALSRYRGSLDLLVTDVIMPGASGPELSRRLISDRPDLRVLFVSGYTDETIASQRLLASGASFLQKPFTPEALARKVRDVLDRPAIAPVDG
ncbi:MAG TPA: PAS domain S-box protein [Thermoanaerobaculia bacterium]|jgi:PAS domain S-box-containing protein|nr:PAS domain S-box protein [Thermoanaerobaculia bacterium]